MNDLLAALLLGIIEGITEFLPISSTGHLLIAERWLGHRSDLFNVAIQAGAILAVVLIYRRRLLGLLAAVSLLALHLHFESRDRDLLHAHLQAARALGPLYPALGVFAQGHRHRIAPRRIA